MCPVSTGDLSIEAESTFMKQANSTPSTRYRSIDKAETRLKYHLAWTSKFARPVLCGAIARRLEELLRLRASEIGVEIHDIEVREDDVRLIVTAPPTDAVVHWVSQLKNYTASILRDEFPELRAKLPSLWSRSYMAVSVGEELTDEQIQAYREKRKWGAEGA
jgi:putative transposase